MFLPSSVGTSKDWLSQDILTSWSKIIGTIWFKVLNFILFNYLCFFMLKIIRFPWTSLETDFFPDFDGISLVNKTKFLVSLDKIIFLIS